MSKKRSRSGSRFGSQISAEAELRYAPQIDALAALLKQATSDRDLGLQVQRTTREGLVQTARGAQPSVQQALQASLGTIDQALQGVPVQGLMASDIAATKARLADQAARTATELGERQNDAAAGYAAGVRGVQSQYGSDRGKIADQLRSLAGQEGAFKSSRLAELLGEDRKLRHDTNQQTRQQRFTAGENEKSREVTRRGQDLTHEDRKKSAKKARWATPQQQGQFQDSVARAVAALKPYIERGVDRRKVAQLFLQGAPAATSVDEAMYRELVDQGVDKTDARRQATSHAEAIPAIAQLPLSVALDVAYDGHISRRNVGELHKRRIKAGHLGYPTAAGTPRPERAPQKAPPARAPRFPSSIDPFAPLSGR